MNDDSKKNSIAAPVEPLGVAIRHDSIAAQAERLRQVLNPASDILRMRQESLGLLQRSNSMNSIAEAARRMSEMSSASLARRALDESVFAKASLLATNPYASILESLESARRIAELSDPMQALQRLADSSPLSELRRTLESLNANPGGQFRLFADPNSAYVSSLENMRSLVAAATSPSFGDDFTRPWLRLAKDAASAASAAERIRSNEVILASTASANYVDAILGHLAADGNLGTRPDFARKLLAPSIDFARFASRALEQQNSARAFKPYGSLRIAQVQLDALAGLLPLVLPETLDRLPLPPRRKCNLFDLQQEELAESEPVDEGEEDISALVERSATAQAAAQVLSVVELVTRCNDIALFGGADEIFKPTSRFALAMVHLACIVPVDERSLKDFVDGLYFVFYEATGKDHLRFTTANGGPLEKADPVCDFVWVVKRLRNHWARHDVDHGKEADVRKKRQSLAEDFKWLGVGGLPVTQADYKAFHAALLGRAHEFALELAGRLQSQYSSASS